MTHLLFPGRHLLHTSFQETYLRQLLNIPLTQLTFSSVPGGLPSGPIDSLVFAITSANHQFTRYNPIPFHIRAIGVDRFARSLEEAYAIQYQIYGIPHYAPTDRFADIILKEIVEQTEADVLLTPSDTVVLTSTPPIMEMFASLGFAILPAEAESAPPHPDRPHDVMKLVVEAEQGWQDDTIIRQKLSPSTYELWRDFPYVIRRVRRLWQDPLLNDAGTLSATRNYSTYAYAMGHDAIIDIKYADIKRHIHPGRIVDEGCADCALLVRIARDFPDSDLIGIEIASELIARCQERLRAGEFGEAFVYFHQRNLTQPIFQPASVDTVICNSTLHELWSYNNQVETILQYLHEKHRQLRPGGRLLIRDVVGPEAGDQEVYLQLAQGDGEAWDPNREDQRPGELSTYARFFRFANDFVTSRDLHRTDVSYKVANVDGDTFVVTSLRMAVEYMTKKDYVTNWESEMGEEFAFWSFSDWVEALEQVGFDVLHGGASVPSASHVYTNQWIVDNRWRGKVKLYRLVDGSLVELPYPPTTMVIVAEKPPLT